MASNACGPHGPSNRPYMIQAIYLKQYEYKVLQNIHVNIYYTSLLLMLMLLGFDDDFEY